MMSMRHFYYISQTKVEMLSGQIQTKPFLSNINTKVEGFGVSVGLGIEAGDEKSRESKLAYETNKLIDVLIKEEKVISIKDSAQQDSSIYYHDLGDWAHGLYSIRQTGTDNHTITYMMWKASGSDIFLLFGSPMNVLGTNEVSEGTEHKSGSSSIINNVIETSLQDEFIGAIYDCGKADPKEKTSVTVLSSQDPRFKINVGSWTPTARVRAEQKVIRGSALALLCQQALTRLPTSKIETLFKVYYEFHVSRSIAPFDRLYLGSPLFTALK